ncbi:uncharacterized protein LOC134830586 isoform X2 [Culicoides brevitarsis]|uniref:uncharacterized protein LOC134830586 isoform X2 n=1 Tax=Culicoides brevitarsis TaxID=469753 RepID=UPI00307C241F
MQSFSKIYATYQSVPLKISRIAPPVRFTTSPYIEDFANGQLLTTQNKVAFSEVSFVLYYAPWCAESKIVRKIYENVANVYGNRIYFSSINCWQPGGECRQQYSNVPNWPTIMSYRSTGFGIQYNGHLSENSLLNFIDSLMFPMKRITTLNDLLLMMNRHNIVVLAIINMERDLRHFKAYYQASLKYLEVDPYREVSFAVCTGESSKAFGTKGLPTIRIHLWNETLEYTEPIWIAKDIVKYIKSSSHQFQKWLSPHGKSNSIATHFSKSSLLLVFTPRIYSPNAFSFYNMVRQIGHIYHNCYNDSWVKELTGQYFSKFHETDLKNSLKLQQLCKNFNYNSNSNSNEAEYPNNFQKFLERDERSPKSLIIQNNLLRCKTLDYEQNVLNNVRIENFKVLDEISGLSCMCNKTSSTVVLDSITYEVFARQLGIDLNKKQFKTAVAILDDENESVFVMNKSITSNNIVDFIKGYSFGSLQKFKRSKTALPTTFFYSKFGYNTTLKISIKEVSSDILFNKIVFENRNSTMTTVLFIYSSQCNFCNMMSHYLLSISSTLKSLKNVEFLRIDGDQNDLNVNYGQEGFPLLIIYTQNSEKVIFPSKLKVTKQNIISFILSNLPKSSRIHGISLFCKSFSRPSYLDRCSKVLRSEVSGAIEKTLKLWREDVASRSYMYKAILALQKLYIQLINVKSEEFIYIEDKIKFVSALWYKVKIF